MDGWIDSLLTQQTSTLQCLYFTLPAISQSLFTTDTFGLFSELSIYRITKKKKSRVSFAFLKNDYTFEFQPNLLILKATLLQLISFNGFDVLQGELLFWKSHRKSTDLKGY